MAPSNEKVRYIFDISSISQYVSKNAAYSGIQRVVAMLIPSFYRIIPEKMRNNAYFGVYDRKSGRYRCGHLFEIVNSMQSPQELASRLHASKSKRPASTPKLKPIDKYSNSPLKFYFHRAKFDFYYALGKDGYFLRKNTTREEWRTARWPKSQQQNRMTVPKMVDIDQVARPGDVVVLLDSSWLPSMNTVFQNLAQRGLIIHVMVYDLISLSAPGYVVKSLAQTFALWLKQSVSFAHSYIAISQSVREEMENFLHHSGADQSVRALR